MNKRHNVGQNHGQNAGQNEGQNYGQNAGQNEGQNAGQNHGQNHGQNAGQNGGKNWQRDLESSLRSIPIVGDLLGKVRQAFPAIGTATRIREQSLTSHRTKINPLTSRPKLLPSTSTTARRAIPRVSSVSCSL